MNAMYNLKRLGKSNTMAYLLSLSFFCSVCRNSRSSYQPDCDIQTIKSESTVRERERGDVSKLFFYVLTAGQIIENYQTSAQCVSYQSYFYSSPRLTDDY